MDRDFRVQLLHALITDRAFLHSSGHAVSHSLFTDRAEQIVCRVATGYWGVYAEPVGPLLRDLCSEEAEKEQLSDDSRVKLRQLIEELRSADFVPVSIQALTDRVSSMRASVFWDRALDEIITAKETGVLTRKTLEELYERAGLELAVASVDTFNVLDLDSLGDRIARRAAPETERLPMLMIPELDEQIKIIGRGHLGMFLAPPASGKGQALNHVAIAYAMQNWNVLQFSLEDPKDEVEDRYDACLTGIPKNRLAELPNRLKSRFARAMERIKGRIKVVDGTEGGWTVTRIEQTWEQMRRDGFIADAIVIDYDDEVVPEIKRTGEGYRRFEFSDMYRSMRKMAARRQVAVWTAGQTARQAEAKRVITGVDVAEDYSKIRKTTICISIGQDPDEADVKHLHVIRHKLDRSKFGVDIVSNFRAGIFYDFEATAARKAIPEE